MKVSECLALTPGPGASNLGGHSPSCLQRPPAHVSDPLCAMWDWLGHSGSFQACSDRRLPVARLIHELPVSPDRIFGHRTRDRHNPLVASLQVTVVSRSPSTRPDLDCGSCRAARRCCRLGRSVPGARAGGVHRAVRRSSVGGSCRGCRGRLVRVRQ